MKPKHPPYHMYPKMPMMPYDMSHMMDSDMCKAYYHCKKAYKYMKKMMMKHCYHMPKYMESSSSAHMCDHSAD